VTEKLNPDWTWNLWCKW